MKYNEEVKNNSVTDSVTDSVNEFTTYDLIKRRMKYDDADECKKNDWRSGAEISINHRHPDIKTIIFTAGDKEDIERYGYVELIKKWGDDITPNDITRNDITPSDITRNAFYKINYDIGISSIYDNYDFYDIRNTVEYIFENYKRGVLIGIKNNKLSIFLPFTSKKMRTNVTSMYIDSEDKKIMEMIDGLIKKDENENDGLNEAEKKELDKLVKISMNNVRREIERNEGEKNKKVDQKINRIELDRRKWMINNCFLNTTRGEYVADGNALLMLDMMNELLSKRKVSDCIFLFQDRDHNIIREDFKEAYDAVYRNDELIDNKYLKYKFAPIMEFGGRKNYAGIPIINFEDWQYYTSQYFADGCENGYVTEKISNLEKNWKNKINKLFFRGAATGCGITPETNIRLKLCELANLKPEYFDVAINKSNEKFKITSDGIKMINLNEMKRRKIDINKKFTADNNEKSKYKYIIVLDGHVAAYRLNFDLSLGSVIFLVENSKYRIWSTRLLEPWKTFIPVNEDLSDLIDKIKWCIDNDDECKKISNNTSELYNTYLNKEGMLDYMQYSIYKLSTIQNKNFIRELKYPNKKIAIITSFRSNTDRSKGINDDRDRELDMYLQFYPKIMKKLCGDNFHIYIIEQQNDGEKFNIAKLKNVGYDIVFNKLKCDYDNIVFIDIDNLANSYLLDYFFYNYSNDICILSRFGTRYSTDKHNRKLDPLKQYYSCSNIVITPESFLKCNGYPNNFWGWGGEDDAFRLRLYLNNINFSLPDDNTFIIDTESNNEGKLIDTVELKKKDLVDTFIEMNKFEKIINQTISYQNNGINQLNYDIISRFDSGDNVSVFKVDLQKKKDEDEYNFWFDMSNLSNKSFDEIKNINRLMIKDVIENSRSKTLFRK